MSTVITLFRASVKEFVRDRGALFWTFAFPLVFIVLFGVIFAGGGSANYTVGIVNQDGGDVSQQIVGAFNGIKSFKIKSGGFDDELSQLKKGNLDMLIVLPAGLSQAVHADQTTTTVQMYYDPSKGQADAQIKLGIVQQVLDGFNKHYVTQLTPLALQPNSVASTNLTFEDFLVPGILAMALMQLGLFGTTMPLVSLRQDQVLRRLGATPLPRWTLLASQILLRLTLALLQTVLILGLATGAFHVHIIGNYLALLGIVVLGSLAFIGLGYLLASVSKSVESANGLVSAVNFPMMFLSGIFFPIAVLPAFLSPVVRALPLTYLGDAARQVMVGSTPEFPILVDIAVLAGWLVVCSLLSLRLFKWE
ncbi:MAG TPA: ABC transporter permease [Ktedonobacterales bacterium]|nr:ABC transporter permease [Ktedonobacterales bacterium]